MSQLQHKGALRHVSTHLALVLRYSLIRLRRIHKRLWLEGTILLRSCMVDQGRVKRRRQQVFRTKTDVSGF